MKTRTWAWGLNSFLELFLKECYVLKSSGNAYHPQALWDPQHCQEKETADGEALHRQRDSYLTVGVSKLETMFALPAPTAPAFHVCPESIALPDQTWWTQLQNFRPPKSPPDENATFQLLSLQTQVSCHASASPHAHRPSIQPLKRLDQKPGVTHWPSLASVFSSVSQSVCSTQHLKYPWMYLSHLPLHGSLHFQSHPASNNSPDNKYTQQHHSVSGSPLLSSLHSFCILENEPLLAVPATVPQVHLNPFKPLILLSSRQCYC